MSNSFDESRAISRLKHILPTQSPLKDFIHHNTLHGFQEKKFLAGIREASQILGYKVSLRLDMYRDLFGDGKISEKILDRVLTETKGLDQLSVWKKKLIQAQYNQHLPPRIGSLRAAWKRDYGVDLDSLVHPILFRILCSFLDQGIAIWGFPDKDLGFL